jgi:5-hydroxyisourate hydrolase-like protein (transthyretin family)
VKLDVSVTDGTNGRPVDGLPLCLERLGLDHWQRVWDGVTGEDGRCCCCLGSRDAQGTFRLTLETDRYFATLGLRPFYSHITVAFAGGESHERRELPVVVTPRGYAVCAVG